MAKNKNDKDGAGRMAVVVLNKLYDGIYSFSAEEIIQDDPTLAGVLGGDSYERYGRNVFLEVLGTKKQLRNMRFNYVFAPNAKIKGCNPFDVRYCELTDILIALGPDYLAEWFKTWTRTRTKAAQKQDPNHTETVVKQINKMLCTKIPFTKRTIFMHELLALENRTRDTEEPEEA